jgi:glycosyltransferase involved in cell wall biosynthesis
MKKILIIGQLPKEYGGTYSTGVANVIVNLLPFIPKDKFDKHLWASNILTFKSKDIHQAKVYGIGKERLVFLILKYIIRYPKRVLSFKKYEEFGIKPIRNLIYEICINELIGKIQPDIIHVHNIGFLPSVFFANNKENDNILLTYHGIFYNDKNSIEQSFKNGVDLKKLFYNASKLVHNFTTLTESMKKEANDLLHIKSKKFNIISNGVGAQFYFDELERKLLRKELNFTEKDNVFISVGALTKRKNHIGAIKFLQNNVKHFKYIIVGKDGDFKDEVKNEIKNDSRVSLIPYLQNKELYKYYSTSDYFILPSTQEGQSLVCLEAFSCGLPILINNEIIGTLGVSNCFDNYRCTINFNSTNNFKVMDKLNLQDRENLALLSKNKLGWKSVSKKYTTLYEQINN